MHTIKFDEVTNYITIYKINSKPLFGIL